MTTIILVSIGVLIAAAAALFIVFYGGDAFNGGQTKAEAARLVTEGQQISYATDLFYRQEDRLPGRKDDGTLDGKLAVKELLDRDYLDRLPAGARLTDTDDWKMEYGADGMIYSKLGPSTDDKALDVCRQARKQLSYKDFDTVYKCDGSDYPKAHPTGTLPDREPCCIRN